ncbi:conserved hypothetical protein [Trichinella spiralis]|uniref:hypothetical protein n=1 Tax=Trichinella spiralis TaxID=6334 RepID=UPI0001EFE9FE|nr:conserved hypothetical protein [Trichinella spiralis]
MLVVVRKHHARYSSLAWAFARRAYVSLCFVSGAFRFIAAVQCVEKAREREREREKLVLLKSCTLFPLSLAKDEQRQRRQLVVVFYACVSLQIFPLLATPCKLAALLTRVALPEAVYQRSAAKDR